MDADGSRSTTNQQNNNDKIDKSDKNEHKVARVLLAPLVWLDKGISAILKKALGTNYADVTEDEVRNLVDALASDDDEDGIEENSAQMINNIFEFDDMDVANIMTHRTDMDSVDADDPLPDIISIAIECGHSRIPVYKEDQDLSLIHI